MSLTQVSIFHTQGSIRLFLWERPNLLSPTVIAAHIYFCSYSFFHSINSNTILSDFILSGSTSIFDNTMDININSCTLLTMYTVQGVRKYSFVQLYNILCKLTYMNVNLSVYAANQQVIHCPLLTLHYGCVWWGGEAGILGTASLPTTSFPSPSSTTSSSYLLSLTLPSSDHELPKEEMRTAMGWGNIHHPFLPYLKSVSSVKSAGWMWLWSGWPHIFEGKAPILFLKRAKGARDGGWGF